MRTVRRKGPVRARPRSQAERRRITNPANRRFKSARGFQWAAMFQGRRASLAMRLRRVRFSSGPPKKAYQDETYRRLGEFGRPSRLRTGRPDDMSVRIARRRPCDRTRIGIPSALRRRGRKAVRVRVPPIAPSRVRLTVGHLTVDQGRGSALGVQVPHPGPSESSSAVERLPHKQRRSRVRAPSLLPLSVQTISIRFICERGERHEAR